MNQTLAKHIGIAALKAREQKSLCGTLMAFAANSPFDENPCSYKLLKQFNPPTNDTSQLFKVISVNMQQLFKPGVAYYKVGIGEPWSMRREFQTPQDTTNWHHIPHISC